MPKLAADLDSRDVEVLQPDFREKILKLIEACQARGIRMVPFFTVRGPLIQGKLWCQSRSWGEAQAQAKLLYTAGAMVMSSYLREEWCAKGRWATNALPGQSWHQWAQACDCYAEINGKAVWGGSPYTIVYAEEAVKLGLNAGANWPLAKDPVHVQLSPIGSPMRVGSGMTWAEVEASMAEIFDVALPT